MVAHVFVTFTSVLPEFKMVKPAESCRVAVSLFASVTSDISEKGKNTSMAIQKNQTQTIFFMNYVHVSIGEILV